MTQYDDLVLAERGAYAIYIGNRDGGLLYHAEFPAMPRASLSASASSSSAATDNAEPLFAISMLFRDWLTALSGPNGSGDGLKALRTNHYKLHFMSTLTGLKFALMTDPSFPTRDGQEMLRRIYEGPYVEFVSSDAAFAANPKERIQSPSFRSAVAALVDDAVRRSLS